MRTHGGFTIHDARLRAAGRRTSLRGEMAVMEKAPNVVSEVIAIACPPRHQVHIPFTGELYLNTFQPIRDPSTGWHRRRR